MDRQQDVELHSEWVRCQRMICPHEVMAVLPQHTMMWIAGCFPVASFAVSFALYHWTSRAWLCTLVVLAGSVTALWVVFTFKFWPWLLLYLFLAWFGCWSAHMVKSGSLFPRN